MYTYAELQRRWQDLNKVNDSQRTIYPLPRAMIQRYADLAKEYVEAPQELGVISPQDSHAPGKYFRTIAGFCYYARFAMPVVARTEDVPVRLDAYMLWSALSTMEDSVAYSWEFLKREKGRTAERVAMVASLHRELVQILKEI